MTNNDSDASIGPIHLPEEMVTITPMPSGLTFAYQRAPDGTDLIAVFVEDKRVGTVRSLFTVDGARVLAATVTAMLQQVDTLRAEWRNTGLDS
ncbi:MAG: hypothetical protein HYZ38_12985 [Mycobacterium sp.]|nr:hypothetical protein [Mycobacterium sp.]